MATEKPYRWHCYFCGQIMSFKHGYYEWTPFGGAEDVDPPTERQAHVECFDKGRIGKQWIGPTLHAA